MYSQRVSTSLHSFNRLEAEKLYMLGSGILYCENLNWGELRVFDGLWIMTSLGFL